MLNRATVEVKAGRMTGEIQNYFALSQVLFEVFNHVKNYFDKIQK